MPIRTRIVKIGRSQGIRIPRSILSQVGRNGEVEIDVQDGHLVLSPARRPRAGWAAAFAAMARAADDPGILQGTKVFAERSDASSGGHAVLRETGEGPENRRAVHLSGSTQRQ